MPALLLAATCCLAGPKPEKIQISDPANPNPVAVSNLHRLDPSKSFSKQIEEDIFRPFKSSDSANSLDPVMTPFRPPQQQPVPTKRQRELMDQRRNWAFANSSDLLPQEPTLEESMNVKQYGPDGREKESLSLIEKYYNRQGTNHNPTAIEISEIPGAGRNRDFAGTNAFNSQNFSTPTNEHVAWNLSAPETDSTLPAWAGGSAGTLAISPEEQARIDKHNLEFKTLLDGHLAGSPEAIAKNPNGAAVAGVAVPVPGANPFATPAPNVEHRNAANPILGASIQTPNFRPHVLDDPTARALGLPQQPVTKPVEEPKPAPKVTGRFESTLPASKF